MGTTQESRPQETGDTNQAQHDPNHVSTASDTQSGTEPALSFNEFQSACEQSGLTLDDVLTERLRRRTSEAHPTSTALLLSDQCPFSTVCVRFANDSKDTIIGKSTLTGSLLHQMREAEAFLAADGTGNTWPSNAVHEALSNAMLHRDYQYSGPTIINRFPSRIEIISLGGLVSGLSSDDLLNGICQPRNPELANAFALLGWSQNCGVGIQRIMDAYAEASDYPQLRVGPGSVAVVLPILSRLHLSTDDDAQTAAPPAPAPTAKRYTFPAVSGETAGPTNTAGPNIVWLAAPTPASASPAASLEAMTLRLLATAGLPLSRTEIETTLQLDKNRSTRILRNLERQGKVVRQGRSRATRYRLA